MNTFFENLPIYYINLEYREDRNSSMLSQFANLNINNYKRINAVDKKTVKAVFKMTESEVACSMSHLKALSEFLESNSEFAMICEDDLDLSNSLKINFNFYEMKPSSKDNYCLQTSLVKREDEYIRFLLSSRTFWDFGTMSYIINRQYASKVVSNYLLDEKVAFNNFQPRTIKDPRSGVIETRPVADELIYSLCDTKVFPLFTYNISDSDIGSTDEYSRQFVKSRKDFLNYWSMFKNATLLQVTQQ